MNNVFILILKQEYFFLNSEESHYSDWFWLEREKQMLLSADLHNSFNSFHKGFQNYINYRIISIGGN